MLEIRLPAFKRGYEQGRAAQKPMTDEEVIANLELLFKEGLFLDPDRTKLQWHVGYLLAMIRDDGRTNHDPDQTPKS